MGSLPKLYIDRPYTPPATITKIRGGVTMANNCDLVLEGGGVKGIGLIGAISVLAENGYQFKRVAGTSAGAIIGSLVAAGMPVDKMLSTMRAVDYRKFRDKGVLDNLGIFGQSASLAFEKGIYEGEYLRKWLSEQLSALGVHTFADLKLTEPWAKKLPPEQRYKLVVVVSDISRGRMVRLPWDYKAYDLDPDKQMVADAVRASMSIPFFYEPVKLRDKYLVDGGLLSNFPITTFDDHNDWPTFGVKLSAKTDANMTMHPVKNPLDYALAIISTAQGAHDQMHIDNPCTQKRTIFVDTFNIKATDFDITGEQQQKLFESGTKNAHEFIKTWDYAKYKKVCPL